MAYKTLQSYAETDNKKWLDIADQEQAKTNAANVQGFNSYGDMLNYRGTQSYATNGQSGNNSRPVAVGTSGADEFFLSDQGYDIVQNAKNMYAQATTQEERDYWHNVAEQERAKAGYSGGSDGSMYLSAAPQDFTLRYGLQEDDYGGGVGVGGAGGVGGGYGGQYGGQIDALLNGILNRKAFSYNKDTDPLYQQYKESYTRAGNRAMQDTLAQVSARTGGLASSYANSASQQTYNNYMAELADKVPELYQMAYSMYMDDLSQQRADLNMVMGVDNMYYDRHRDTVGDQQWQQQFDYNAGRDAVADRQWQQQFDYNAMLNDREWEYKLAQDALASQRSSSGGGGGGEKPKLTWAQVLAQIEAGNLTPNVLSAYEYYMGTGYDSGKPQEEPAPILDYNTERYVATAKRLLDQEKNYESQVSMLEALAAEGKLTENQLNELLDYIGTKK